jgi:hypothetical protein
LKLSSTPPRVPDTHSSRTVWTIGWPLSVATGAVRPSPLFARGASGSQPDQTIVQPLRIGKPLPTSAIVFGSFTPCGPSAMLPNSILRPRLLTS